MFSQAGGVFVKSIPGRHDCPPGVRTLKSFKLTGPKSFRDCGESNDFRHFREWAKQVLPGLLTSMLCENGTVSCLRTELQLTGGISSLAGVHHWGQRVSPKGIESDVGLKLSPE